MKKRIIALLLSFAVLCSSLTFSKRANAVALDIGIGIFNIAWYLIGICTGRYDDAVDAIRNDSEHFVDYFQSHDSSVFGHTDSQFVQDWRAGWEVISDWLSFEVDAGNILVDENSIKLSRAQFLDAYRQLVSVANKSTVNFDSDYFSFVIDITSNFEKFPIGALPTLSNFLTVLPGESYALFYYNDDNIIFSDYYICVYADDEKRSYGYNFYSLSSNYSVTHHKGFVYAGNSSLFDDPKNWFSFLSLSFAKYNNYSLNTPFDYTTTNCFLFSDGIVTPTLISDIDLTGYTPSLVSTSHDYGGFLQSLTDYSIKLPATSDSDLTDLSNVLPKDDDVTLEFPLNPDLDKSIPSQVVVGDVPGVDDLPLEDYLKNALNINVNVPSVITKKFPFCIPFDLVRFFGVLAADPIPPVFHIPISTHPANLEQWADNQTIGNLVSPDDPMFEIDEEIVLDFAHIPLVQPISYTVFIVGFVFLLIHITSKMIQH